MVFPLEIRANDFVFDMNLTPAYANAIDDTQEIIKRAYLRDIYGWENFWFYEEEMLEVPKSLKRGAKLIVGCYASFEVENVPGAEDRRIENMLWLASLLPDAVPNNGGTLSTLAEWEQSVRQNRAGYPELGEYLDAQAAAEAQQTIETESLQLQTRNGSGPDDYQGLKGSIVAS